MMLVWEQTGEKAFLMVKKSARRARRTHNPAFKARVALAALREDKKMYLKAYDSVSATRADIADYLHWLQHEQTAFESE